MLVDSKGFLSGLISKKPEMKPRWEKKLEEECAGLGVFGYEYPTSGANFTSFTSQLTVDGETKEYRQQPTVLFLVCTLLLTSYICSFFFTWTCATVACICPEMCEPTHSKSAFYASALHIAKAARIVSIFSCFFSMSSCFPGSCLLLCRYLFVRFFFSGQCCHQFCCVTLGLLIQVFTLLS